VINQLFWQKKLAYIEFNYSFWRSLKIILKYPCDRFKCQCTIEQKDAWIEIQVLRSMDAEPAMQKNQHHCTAGCRERFRETSAFFSTNDIVPLPQLERISLINKLKPSYMGTDTERRVFDELSIYLLCECLCTTYFPPGFRTSVKLDSDFFITY